MARRAICKVSPGGSVTVQSRDYGRIFGPGTVCDLDEVVIPAEGDRPAQTLGDALGKDLELFDVTGETESAAEKPPTRGRRKGAEE